MYKMGFKGAEESDIKFPALIRSWRKQWSSRKTSTSDSLTMLKPLTGWITTNCGKFFKRWEYQTTLPVSWETCMQIKKDQLELNMEQLVQNWESSMTKLYIVTCLLNSYAECVLACSLIPDSLWPLWTTAHQALLSTGVSQQEYWSQLPFPSPGDLPDQKLEPSFPAYLHWQADSLPVIHLVIL